MNPESPGKNPYEFILNPTQPQKPAPLSGNKGFILKICLIIGALIVLMIGISILMNALNSNKNKAVENLKNIPLTQQELIRVAGTGLDNVTSQPLKNFAITTKLTISGQQQNMINYLAEQGVKTTAKQLALSRSTTTDALLSQAKENSTYDLIFTQQMTKSLNAYLTSINNTYKTVTGPTARKLLKTDYDQTQMLLKMLPTEDDSTNTTTQ